eukprot:9492262-Pyramimonas_sp.AAC.1
MQQMPLSASINAPASMQNSPVSGSCSRPRTHFRYIDSSIEIFQGKFVARHIPGNPLIKSIRHPEYTNVPGILISRPKYSRAVRIGLYIGGPIGRRTRGYTLTPDQSDASGAGIFSHLGDGGGEAGGGGGLAGGVDGPGEELGDVLKKLTFGAGGVAHDAHVDVPAQLDALGGLLVYATEQHQEHRPLDVEVPKHRRRHRLHLSDEKA